MTDIAPSRLWPEPHHSQHGFLHAMFLVNAKGYNLLLMDVALSIVLWNTNYHVHQGSNTLGFSS